VLLKHQNAYTLVELVIVVAMVGFFAFIAIPRLQFGAVHQKKADGVARKLVTDLRRSRSMALRDAVSNTAGYQVVMTGASPYTGYDIKDLSNSSTVDSFTIPSNVTVTCPGNLNFDFGPLGNLKSGSGTQIIVSANGKTFTLTITSATGSVVCTTS